MLGLITILLCLSTFISAWTLGLRTITDKGMVLYPIRKWCFKFGKIRQGKIILDIFQANKRIKKIQSQGSPTEKGKIAIQSEKNLIESWQWESFKIEAWHKPLITCAACMSSVHGLLVSGYFFWLVGIEILYVCPFSIMLSVVINSFIWKRL